MSEPTIYVTQYRPPVTNTQPASAGELTLAQLAEGLSTFWTTPDPENEAEAKAIKETLGSMSPARLKAGTTRSNANVIDMSAVVFDVDNKHEGAPLEIAQADQLLEQRLNCALIIHTTYQHKLFSDRPRFRIWIPLAKPVPASRYKALWAQVRQALPEARGMIDTLDAPQHIFFIPACPKSKLFDLEVVPRIDRPLLDPETILPPDPPVDLGKFRDQRKSERKRPPARHPEPPPRPTGGQTAEEAARIYSNIRETPDLRALNISPQMVRLIEEGAPKGERSEALAKVYVALHSAGVDERLILGTVTDPEHGISEKPLERGDTWVLQDIDRVLSKHRERAKQMQERASILDDIARLVEEGNRSAAADLCLSQEAAQAFAHWYASDKPAATRWRVTVVKQGLKGLVSLGDFDPLWRDCAAQQGQSDDEAMEPDAWQEAVQGTKLLTSISKGIRRFVVLSEAAADACALFVLHTWCFDAAERTPFLFINAPTKRSGKTVMLEVLEQLVRRPYWGANTSPAGLFRLIEKHRHTVLLDEVHHLFHRNADPELVRMLNTSHSKRGASVDRCVEVSGEIEVRSFSIWSPKVLAGILKPEIPEEIIDRSILICLRRKTRGEHTERAREHNLQTLRPLAAQAKRWALDHAEPLAHVTPQMPQELNDRACDCWEPLVAVADLIGGRWPERARTVACELAQGATGDSADDGVALVQDIRKAFDLVAEQVLLGDDDNSALFFGDPPGINTEEQITSHAMQRLLCHADAFVDRPWQEWSRGREIASRDIARLLAPFGVKPRRIGQPTQHVTGKRRVMRGYRRLDFEELWDRYPPEEYSCD